MPDVYGNTALWRAAFESRGQGAMLKLLLAHGANPDQPNHSGMSPRQLAETIANFDVKRGVIQNYALPFSSVIGIGLCASLRASDTGPISCLEKGRIVLNYTHVKQFFA